MTSIELGQLRGVLEARSAELQDLLRNRAVIAVSSSAEMLDQIQHASERDMALGNLERDSLRLREVRAALIRIELGTFGTCLACQEEINLKRLAAVPWTSLCLLCRKAADGSRKLPQDMIEEAFLNA